MMTTLFSVSFTSCIDNEVSPLVEAIYEAQADLIAAQAGVQNAEAALLLAQANAVQAQAAAQAQANASLTTGQLAVLMANAAFTNAQAALIMAQANSLASMTAAQVLNLIAEAGLTDAQAALIIAQSNSIEDMTAAQVLGLIASANLTDAQAAMVLAQADAVTAMTDAQVAQMLANAGYTDAQTAYMLAQIARFEAETAQNALIAEQMLLEQIAETNLNVAAAQNALALAQITFQTQMAAAMAAMEAAGAQLAVGYAWDYAYAMQHANNLMQQLLGAKADLANAQLMQTGGVSWQFYLAQLQGNVATSMAAKADLETAIAALEAYIANPSTPEAIISGLKAQNIAYHEAMDAKEIEMQVQYNKIMAIYQENGVRNVIDNRIFDSLDEHNYAVDEKNARLEDIAAAQIDVDILIAKKASYATDLQAATEAVTNTTQAYNDAWTALGMTNGAGVSYKTAANTYFGQYFLVDAAGGPIVAGATKYATPANLQQVYVNARITKLNAEADLADYQADFDALVLTYNQAAVALAAAQLAFDNSTAAADLATANTNYNTALTTRNTALNTTYADAKSDFELFPTGVQWFDGDDTGFNWVQTPYIGNHADAFPNSFAKILTFAENPIGSGQYRPVPGAYSTTYLTAIPANVVDNIATPLVDETLNNYEFGSPGYLTAAQVITVNNGNAAYYVNVENDDYSLTNLYIFNVATNMLGTNNFSTRPFYTSGAGTLASPYVFNTVLTPASTDAGYDSTPDANGMANSAPDMLTAQAALWNAGLEKFKKQNAFDLGDDALIIAENAFAYQKELFDFGVANLAELADDVTDATTAQATAKTNVDNAWKVLGKEFVAGIATDPKKTTSTADAWYYVNFGSSGTKSLTLNAVVFNAEVTKAVLVLCDATCIQGQIDGLNASIAQWTIEIAAIEPIIVAKYNVVAGLLNELTAAGVQYTFTVETDVTTGNLGIGTLVITNYGVISTSLYPDLHAAIIAEWQVYWTMQQELDAIQNAHNLNAALISAYGWWADDLNDLKAYLANLKADLVNANYDIEVAQQALAAAQVQANAATAYIAYYQALVTTLEQRHANTLAIAAKYKALMEAALAS